MPVKMLREFFLLKSAGGILLVIAAVIAILISNSPLENYYHTILNTPVVVALGNFSIDKYFQQWINDGLISNSPLENYHHAISNAPVVAQLGNFAIDKDLRHWINDGLMAIFFLLVSLEIKREVLDGQLSSRSQISLPAIAAFGGLLVPSLIFLSINWGDSTYNRGLLQ